jgi:hypothetical protein
MSGMSDHTDLTRGRLIANVLTAWEDNSLPELSPSVEDLAEVAPLLLNSGAGALGWRWIKRSGWRDIEAFAELHQAYRLHTLQAAIKEIEIGQVFSFLRSHRLEPLIGKGWAIARHYPEPGLRPYGDIDLYVRSEDHAAFLAAFGNPEARGWNIDLHRGAAELDDRSFDELYAHSRLVRLGEVEVRTFGPEDHLRLLCLHMLREGVLRPLWLCDVAVALRSLPSDFDWEYFQSGNERRADWAVCAIGLAHQILGAAVDGLPVAQRAKDLPAWLVPSVLHEWGLGRITNGRRQPMQSFLRHPRGALDALRLRWPNPIEATVSVRGPFNQWPRLPFQIGACVARTARFIYYRN